MSEPTKSLGSLNHLRLSVSDIAKAARFYGPVMGFMGYRLAERGDARLAYVAMGPAGRLQWLILSKADPASPNRRHDRYSPGFHHGSRPHCRSSAARSQWARSAAAA